MENLEKLKKAIEVEVKHRYIDIRGQSQTFSQFIKGEARKIYKTSGKNPRWGVIMETFDGYRCFDVNDRRKAIERLIKVIKLTLDEEKATTVHDPQTQERRLESPDKVDVTYVKGVGPKIAYYLNKLGIYTALDLITYFPRKHIDYSSRTLIKKLHEGENTTVFGYVKSVSAFNTKNNLSVVRVKIQDESGSLELSFFQAKATRVMQERIKAQFPVNAGIMVSGTVKRNNYTGQLTIDKPSYSIMSGEFLESKDSNLNLGRIVPIYTVCEGLNIKTLRRAIFNAIEMYNDYIVDVLPDYIREKHGILPKKISVKQIHFPETMELNSFSLSSSALQKRVRKIWQITPALRSRFTQADLFKNLSKVFRLNSQTDKKKQLMKFLMILTAKSRWLVFYRGMSAAGKPLLQQ